MSLLLWPFLLCPRYFMSSNKMSLTRMSLFYVPRQNVPYQNVPFSFWQPFFLAISIIWPPSLILTRQMQSFRHPSFVAKSQSWFTFLFVYPSFVIRLLLRQKQFSVFFSFYPSSVIRHYNCFGRSETALLMTKIRHPSSVIRHSFLKRRMYLIFLFLTKMSLTEMSLTKKSLK